MVSSTPSTPTPWANRRSGGFRCRSPGGGGTRLLIADASVLGAGGVRVFDGYDLNGSGKEEFFAKVGAGASIEILGLFEVVDCELRRISVEGVPSTFGVGGSLRFVNGLECYDADLNGANDFLIVYTGERLGESSEFEITAEQYALQDGTLRWILADGIAGDETDPGFAKFRQARLSGPRTRPSLALGLVEYGDRSQPPLQVMLQQGSGELIDLTGRGADVPGKHTGQSPTQDPPHHVERLGAQGPTTAMVATPHPAIVEIERLERPRRAALDAVVELRLEALVGQQLQEEGRHHQRAVPLVERAKRPHEHDVEGPIRLSVLSDLIDRLEHRLGSGEAVGVAPQRGEAVERLDLGDRVEVAPAPVELHRNVAERLEPSPELRLRAPHPLRHPPHLAVVVGVEADDAIGFAQLPRTQHHGAVAVERHQPPFASSTPPNRRSRSW